MIFFMLTLVSISATKKPSEVFGGRKTKQRVLCAANVPSSTHANDSRLESSSREAE